jgi:hypothetical protein
MKPRTPRKETCRLLSVSLVALVSLLGAAHTANADCSVIPPKGVDQLGFKGNLTSPFLTPGLTNDIRVPGAECDLASRSAAPDFRVDGVDQLADDFVITIAFTPKDGASSLLVLAADGSLCDGHAGCTVDTGAEREIAEIPLPGGGVERRLRFRVPEDLSVFGPARLSVKLATNPNDLEPVAFTLRDAECDTAAGEFVACIGLFYLGDGSCRTTDAFVNRPFSGLVAIPKTNFTSICTEGCEDAPGWVGPTLSNLPVTTDRDGNAVFSMIYEDQLIREDRGDGQIEPRPRRLRLSLADAVDNGFTDDAPVVYAAKPSSVTFEGFPLSPPFNPFVDPTVDPGQVGIWGMADAPATVHFLPARACAAEPDLACTSDLDCPNGGTCEAPEFDFLQTGAKVELPVAAAIAQQAVELNSWLDGGLDDAAVALTEDERLRNVALNWDGGDEAADDVVAEVLDRNTGLIRRLRGDTVARGLTRVRVAEGDRDFVVPSIAAKGRTLAFFESEFGEGLAGLEGATQLQTLAADLNNNSRLDQNLCVFAIDTANPLEEEAQSLLPESSAIGVLPDLRFRGRKNLVLSEDLGDPDTANDDRLSLFFAYSPLRQEAHDYTLVNQSSDGVAGNSSAGEAVLSSDGTWVAFVSDGNNLYVPAPKGPLSNETSGGTVIQAVTGPDGEFPVVVDGKTVFEYQAIDNGQGPAPSRVYVEIKLCDTALGEPELRDLLNTELSGPNASLRDEATSCSACNFEGSWLVQFDQGLGKGGMKSYSLVFDEPVPPGEVGVSFKAGGKVELTTMRGPACIDPTILAGIDRVYLRNTVTGTTELASAPDRSSCDDQVVAPNDPSGSPDVTLGGSLVFFDSTASLTGDDANGSVEDVYYYNPATCDVVNLTGSLSGPSENPTSSDDGSVVAFQSGDPPEIYRLDRGPDPDVLVNLGPGFDPELSADGSKLVFSADVDGVLQVFLADPDPVAVSLEDGPGGALLADGGGAATVANSSDVAFESPPGAGDSEILVRDDLNDDTSGASLLPTLEPLCNASPCGAFSPSISDDGRFVAFVVSGLAGLPLGVSQEILIKDLVTGSITPLTRMAGADGNSFDPSLGASGDFLGLTSFASQLGSAVVDGLPNVYLEGPDDRTADSQAMLGVLDVTSCLTGGPCEPVLTGENGVPAQPVTKGAAFEADVAVVGSPVRLVEVTGPGSGGIAVTDYGREGSDVALSEKYLCAIETGTQHAMCGLRTGSLSNLTIGGASIPAQAIGLCGARAVALTSGGQLYVADLPGVEASWVGSAQDFETGEDLDLDGDGIADSCLVAFRTPETVLGGSAATVGNRDLDTADLAMFVLGTGDPLTDVTDCVSSTADCPGQACEQFNYQVGRESVLYIVDETEENFNVPDACAIGTDVNLDGLCDLTVRRCTAAGSLTEGTSLSVAGDPFADGRFEDGENVVTIGGFCGPTFDNVRKEALCSENSECLQGETCQGPFLILSALADSDGDEVPDRDDNCPTAYNPGQENTDQICETPPLCLEPDRFGDACDTFTCGDGIINAPEGFEPAEQCDEGLLLNGAPGSSCSATCTCQVNFEVSETLKPGSNGNTPIVIFGSAAPDGSGCVNLDKVDVGGVPAKNIDAATLRLSATPPTESCPTSGGAPAHNLANTGRYNAHLDDLSLDGIQDLKVHADTPGIGGDSTTTVLYLTGRFSDGSCFESMAPVDVAGN